MNLFGEFESRNHFSKTVTFEKTFIEESDQDGMLRNQMKDQPNSYARQIEEGVHSYSNNYRQARPGLL